MISFEEVTQTTINLVREIEVLRNENAQLKKKIEELEKKPEEK